MPGPGGDGVMGGKGTMVRAFGEVLRFFLFLLGDVAVPAACMLMEVGAGMPVVDEEDEDAEVVAPALPLGRPEARTAERGEMGSESSFVCDALGDFGFEN